MIKTFDLFNLDYLIRKNSWFEISQGQRHCDYIVFGKGGNTLVKKFKKNLFIE